MVEIEELAATIESMPDVLLTLLSPLDPAVLGRRPAHGEWCALEVIGHLVTCEGPAFRERIRRIVDGDPEIGNVDIHQLMAGEAFEAGDLQDLVERLRAERAVSAEYLRSITAQDLERTAEHVSYGTLSASDFAHEWPFHDQDHVQQILDAVKPRYLEAMSDPMRTAMSEA